MIYGMPSLRGVCQAVQITDDYTLAMLHDDLTNMHDLLLTTTAYSISAPQVGLSKRMFVANLNNQIVFCINPVMQPMRAPDALATDDYPTYDFPDGCISLPGISASVLRYTRVQLTYQTLAGSGSSLALQNQNILYTDHAAYVVQHEMDHLDGVMYFDHLGNGNGPGSLGYTYGASNLTSSAFDSIANGNYSVPYRTKNLTNPQCLF